MVVVSVICTNEGERAIISHFHTMAPRADNKPRVPRTHSIHFGVLGVVM